MTVGAGQPRDDPALAGDIKQLYLTTTVRLWACVSAFGLARYDGTRWHVEGPAADCPASTSTTGRDVDATAANACGR